MRAAAWRLWWPIWWLLLVRGVGVGVGAEVVREDVLKLQKVKRSRQINTRKMMFEEHWACVRAHVTACVFRTPFIATRLENTTSQSPGGLYSLVNILQVC